MVSHNTPCSVGCTTVPSPCPPQPSIATAVTCDGAMAIIHGSAPHVTYGSATAIIHRGAPHMTCGGATAITHGGAPHMTCGGATAIIHGDAPLLLGMALQQPWGQTCPWAGHHPAGPPQRNRIWRHPSLCCHNTKWQHQALLEACWCPVSHRDTRKRKTVSPSIRFLSNSWKEF